MSPTRLLAPRVGEPRAPGKAGAPRKRPPSRPAVGLGGRDCGRRSGSSVRRCHCAGWDGRKRGKGAAGRGRREGTCAEPAARVPGGKRRVQRAVRGPEAPGLWLLLPGCPETGGRVSRLGRGSPIPPPPPPPPGRTRGPRNHLHPRPGPSAPGARPAPKLPPARPARSLFAARLLPPRRRRLRLPLPASRLCSSEPPAAEGAAAPLRVRRGRSAINTRGRRQRRRGRASRAGGGRPRSEPSKVARGGGEGGAGRVGGERAQGRHGRLDAGPSATRLGRSSGSKRAAAASPPRAPAECPQPCARAGPAVSRPASGK